MEIKGLLCFFKKEKSFKVCISHTHTHTKVESFNILHSRFGDIYYPLSSYSVVESIVFLLLSN